MRRSAAISLALLMDGRYRTVVAGDADHARGISRARFLDVE